jgi:fructose-1,6-bisphosphatase I
MTVQMTLDAYLSGWSPGDPLRSAAAGAIRGIAGAAADIAQRIAYGPLGGDLAATTGEAASGDAQKALDVLANDRIIEALRGAGVAAIASEELAAPMASGSGLVGVAIDPLDGSSNIDTNVSIGTIFSILPAEGAASTDAVFLQPGSAQIAAGYVIYGPRTEMLLSVGEGTHAFTLDPVARQFRLTGANVAIPPASNEYAINASNYRHWSEGVRAYIDDCIAGEEGPRGENVNMRWIASLVAECHRILVRGGVFLYPADARKGYENGRLRLVYEGNPIAFLVEQAGGQAFDGRTRILDIPPSAIHQRTPLIFGSAGEIDRIARYKADPAAIYERSPLFGRRGLLRN